MNSLNLLIIETLLCFTTQVFLYKHYKIKGLYTYTIIAFFLSCLMSLKTISLYNYDINLGIIPLITIFISGDILIQKYGQEEVKKLILTLIGTSIISYGIIYLTKIMNSSDINLFTSASFDNIFNGSLRMYFANIATLLYSLLLNSKLYYYLKKMKNNIIISNLFSEIIIQFIASILFGLLAYIFVKETIDIIKLIMIRYLVSIIIGIIGTIPILLTKKVVE